MSVPKAQFNFLFDEIKFQLEEGQYKNFVNLVERLTLLSRGMQVLH